MRIATSGQSYPLLALCREISTHISGRRCWNTTKRANLGSLHTRMAEQHICGPALLAIMKLSGNLSLPWKGTSARSPIFVGIPKQRPVSLLALSTRQHVCLREHRMIIITKSPAHKSMDMTWIQSLVCLIRRVATSSSRSSLVEMRRSLDYLTLLIALSRLTTAWVRKSALGKSNRWDWGVTFQIKK